MPDLRFASPASRLPVAACGLISAALAVAGCRPADEIRTYRIAKPDSESSLTEAPSARPIATAKPQGDPTDRMLGAIVPGPKQAWFFKAVGPRKTLDTSAEAITTFLKSVRIEGDEPVWSTPDGWSETRGGGMRLATLSIPTPDGAGETELSVIGLGLADDWGTQVLDNVNRWRKQLKQPPLTASELSESVTSLEGIDDRAVLIDELGWFDGATMAPFAGGRATAAAPPVASPPRNNGELKGEKPDAWTDGPASTMRKASYETPGGAAVTAFAFNAAGAMGDRVANVNRWRGEIGLQPTDTEQLAEQTEEIQLLGEEGAYFEMVGETETTYAAMTERDGQVWFFKLRGPNDSVEAQRDAFRGWLESLSL